MIPDVFDASDAVNVLGRFADELNSADLSEVFRGCIETANKGFESNFSLTRGPNGAWPPHSPVTIFLMGPHPLLVWTGDLKQSVTQSGSNGRIESIDRREMVIGTDLFYAGYQQFGTAIIPPRPFLWLDDPWVALIQEYFIEHSYIILIGV